SNGQTSNPGTPGNPSTPPSSGPTATNGPLGMVRLGCSQYCLQAGGYGGGGGTPLTKILTTGVIALPDGTVAITVECLFRQPCLGALLLNASDNSTASACPKPAVARRPVIVVGPTGLDCP